MEQKKLIDPGVYFGMPEAMYHADPALSASGIKNLLISPLTYWMKSALNPDYEPKETEAKEKGTAFHKRLLEGSEKFYAAYAAELSPKDFPKALKSGEQLRAKCASLGLAKNGTLAEMAARIREVDPIIQLWPELEAKWLKENEGKIFLSKATMLEVELAAQSVEADPVSRSFVSGGQEEVSIFWIDSETGIRMKARLDYMGRDFILDLKTFANTMDKPLMQAVTGTIIQRRYGIQAHVYMAAFKAVREQNLLATKVDASGGFSNFSIYPDAWLSRSSEPRFFFLFMETGDVPNILFREYVKVGPQGENAYYETDYLKYRDGVKLYKECADHFGDKKWISPVTISKLEDTDFPAWAFN